MHKRLTLNDTVVCGADAFALSMTSIDRRLKKIVCLKKAEGENQFKMLYLSLVFGSSCGGIFITEAMIGKLMATGYRNIGNVVNNFCKEQGYYYEVATQSF